ncbi:MAG TPA: flavodoxin family protein [Methylomusa anaerophila]|uniref:Iron-sulfur flavoprotein n=1 Tax=Methylomusa anaerophila TaxID=1930071 RepID=A0A348AEQ5_9FIRM|nr:flavodoxin family protein [Methylomusa anaerophila]BBB89553.1 iron-sulfur flavoprotein [Methylomusa anaerophila]HML90079.1 flavodoxin family protein [Methylomusa anaerophila]
MRILIITSSPNEEGLTASCGEIAKQGAESEGAEVNIVSLNGLNVGKCQACGNGWGSCLKEHTCQVNDSFQEIHSSIKDVEGIVLVTPVYWGEMSESAKAFLDRLRRCEARNTEASLIEGKPVICVAAAGGTGNGCISCLTSMEKFADQVRAVKFDFINITRRNREYKLETIKEAAKSLVRSFKR